MHGEYVQYPETVYSVDGFQQPVYESKEIPRSTYVPMRFELHHPVQQAPALKFIKVSAKSNIKNVAGSIAHTSRAGDPPTLMATQKNAVNQSVKALAIARGYLVADNHELNCYPEFRDEERVAVSLALSKVALRHRATQPVEQISKLRVASSSNPAIVAGSMAKRIRAGERVVVVCLGPGSVTQSVISIIIARRYLMRDSIDICFRPTFIHVKLPEGERSALEFTVLANQI